MTKMTKFSRLCMTIILVLIIIYLGSLVDFIFTPIQSLITIVTIPLSISVFFYYLLRPVVNRLVQLKCNRTAAVLIIYLVIGIILAGFSLGVWPSLRTQVITLVDNAPDLFSGLSKQLEEVEQNGMLSKWLPEGNSLLSQLSEYLSKGFTFLTDYITGLYSVISSLALILFIFPIFLFYMLKEGDSFGQLIVKFTPMRYRNDMSEVVSDIDTALSHYIVGKVLINLALGVLMYIGFLIIGLPYTLLLTVTAIILNFIPVIGSVISTIPIVIIGFIESPSIAIWSLVVIFIAQQIQDNLIAPYIYGRQLDIHPMTTIVLVMVGGDMAGIIGMLLVIPVYMMIKIIVMKIYQLFIRHKWESV
ncbi:MAG: AI-2E family transporter [Candidatus Pristimantibacillus sp.]